MQASSASSFKPTVPNDFTISKIEKKDSQDGSASVIEVSVNYQSRQVKLYISGNELPNIDDIKKLGIKNLSIEAKNSPIDNTVIFRGQIGEKIVNLKFSSEGDVTELASKFSGKELRMVKNAFTTTQVSSRELNRGTLIGTTRAPSEEIKKARVAIEELSAQLISNPETGLEKLHEKIKACAQWVSETPSNDPKVKIELDRIQRFLSLELVENPKLKNQKEDLLSIIGKFTGARADKELSDDEDIVPKPKSPPQQEPIERSAPPPPSASLVPPYNESTNAPNQIRAAIQELLKNRTTENLNKIKNHIEDCKQWVSATPSNVVLKEQAELNTIKNILVDIDRMDNQMPGIKDALNDLTDAISDKLLSEDEDISGSTAVGALADNLETRIASERPPPPKLDDTVKKDITDSILLGSKKTPMTDEEMISFLKAVNSAIDAGVTTIEENGKSISIGSILTRFIDRKEVREKASGLLEKSFKKSIENTFFRVNLFPNKSLRENINQFLQTNREDLGFMLEEIEKNIKKNNPQEEFTCDVPDKGKINGAGVRQVLDVDLKKKLEMAEEWLNTKPHDLEKKQNIKNSSIESYVSAQLNLEIGRLVAAHRKTLGNKKEEELTPLLNQYRDSIDKDALVSKIRKEIKSEKILKELRFENFDEMQTLMVKVASESQKPIKDFALSSVPLFKGVLNSYVDLLKQKNKISDEDASKLKTLIKNATKESPDLQALQIIMKELSALGKS